MRPPTITCGKLKIVYKQVPYDSRYYFVYYSIYTPVKLKIAQIPYSVVNLAYGIFLEANGGYNEISVATCNQWNRFQERVGQYNDWLDADIS